MARRPDVIVTLLERAIIRERAAVDGRPILEPGSPVVWFTFPEAHHDIGRFHLADGTFTGFYANVLTPVQGLESESWTTTDLFLDVWLPAAGGERLLDEEELAQALERGWVTRAEADAARAEADRLLSERRAGAWPPAVVGEWTLERARAAALDRPRRVAGSGS